MFGGFHALRRGSCHRSILEQQRRVTKVLRTGYMAELNPINLKFSTT